MNKILIMLSTFLFICCTSNSQNELEIIAKKLDLPIKLLVGTKKEDSTYTYLCFPKRILYNNSTSIFNEVSRYNVNKHQVGTNTRDYRWYKYSDSLVYPKGFEIKPLQKDSIDFYFGYSLKLPNSRLDSLIFNKKISQIYGKLKVYNILADENLKKWALSKINDSIKGQLHFKLYNEDKGFYYKSLDIELFE